MLEKGTLNIECHFISGTNAEGCMVVLVSNFIEVNNISKTFYRRNSELISSGKLNLNESNFCYHQVFGYDVESNGSISDLALPGNLTILGKSTDDSCSKSPMSTGERAGLGYSNQCLNTYLFLCLITVSVGAIIGAVVGSIIVIVFIIGVVFVVVLYISSKRGMPM